MANDIDIRVGVLGSNDILKLTRDLDKTEDNVKQLSIAFKENRITNQALLVGLNQQIKAVKELGVSHTVAKNKVFGLYNEMKQLSVEQLRLQTASGKGMRRFELIAQQAGYQFGDLAVQIQGGTNAAVALGQQGSQLLGFFGPAGALAGAGLAITTAFIAPLIEAKEKVNVLEEKVKNLNEVLNDLDGISKRAALSVKSNLEEAFKDSATAVKGLLDAIDQLEFSSTIKPIQKAMDDVSVSVDKVDVALKTMVGFKRLEDQGVQLDSVQKALLENAEGLVQENLALAIGFDNVKSALDKIGQSRTSKELTENFAKAKAELEKVGGPAAEKALEALIKIAKEAGIADSIMNSLADAAGRLGDNLAFAADISPEVQARAVRAGVESGAIPPQALKDLPQSEAEKVWQKILEGRRSAARSTKSSGGGGGGGGKDKQTVDAYLKGLMEEALYKKQLVGLSEEETRIQEIIFQAKQKDLIVTEEQASAIAAVEEQTRKLIDAEQKRKSMMDTIEGHIEDAFMTMIDGSASVTDAFKGMLRNILLEIYKQQVAKPIASSVGSFISGLIPKSKNANGNAFFDGRIMPFANGGIVNGPTLFPMANGAGLMGEAGPEAIMPLKRGPNGKLGVEASGGQQVVVNQSFNFAANGDESVKKIIAQAAPQIAQMTQKQIMDSRRRGGQMKAAFS